MWKKNEVSNTSTEHNQINSDNISNAEKNNAMNSNTTPTQTAFIGKSIEINGEIVGNEDLIVDGKVNGKITLKNNALKIASDGLIDADIETLSVDIEGRVKGEIRCSDLICIRKNGQVEGDIVSARVILEDGCSFKGTIDTVPQANTKVKNTNAKPATKAAQTKPTENDKVAV